MRRKTRLNRSVSRDRRQMRWVIEECEPRRLLSATLYPILSFSTPPLPGSATRFAGVTAPSNGVLTPTQMRGAYGLPSTSFGGTTGDGRGITIGIVDAYDDPNALTDLQNFDAYYGLANPPSFTKLNQNGAASPLPTTDPAGPGSQSGTWELEESLDIEWAHVIAPMANIILFEANDPTMLFTAVQGADNTPQVSVVSMSFGGDEFSGETGYDSQYFVTPTGHQPITFVASAGDSGAYERGQSPATIAPQYPAASPNVVAVGGTSLIVGPNNTYGSESGWGNGMLSNVEGGGGGGISQYEAKPAYQSGVTQSSTNRTYPDVAMEADPNTGVSIYDSFDFGNAAPWLPGKVGGTSLAAPMFAGVISIANQGRAAVNSPTLDGFTQTLPLLYSAPSSDFHDITLGNNGYPAGPGYDLVTGLGTPVVNKLVDVFQSHIGDFVFNDTNANGIQDDNSGGVPNVTVTLLTPGADGIVGDGDDVTIATTLTDSTGLYFFANVPTGSYYIHFSTALNYHISPQFQGTDPALDSNADPTTGDTPAFSYVAGTTNDTIDCGQYSESLSITDASVLEGNSGLTPITFTVSLGGISTTGFTVAYTTQDGTATVANNDYIPQSGTLTFAAGQPTATITVEVVGDTNIENNETFSVVLTNPTGFGVGNLTGTGTIINDDFPTVSVSSFSLLRPDSGTVLYPFTFTLSAPAPFEVDVPYTTQDVTAVGDVDYTIATGTLVFLPNAPLTETVDVTVFGSTTPTLDKTFHMAALASPTVDIIPASVGTGTILSNSPPAVNIADAQITESLTGLAYLQFDVSVLPALTGTITVDYATANGTAVAGTDYAAESGTLVFTPGNIEKTVDVPVYRLFTSQQDKTLTLNLSNLSAPGNVILSHASATGTIHDLQVYTIPLSSSEKAVYTDYLNDKVTVSLNGPGDGSVLFLGTQSTATDAYEIVLTGTTSATDLTIKTPHKDQTSFRNIVSDGSLGSISGKTVNLEGQVTTAGSLNNLQLNYVSASTITVGDGSGQLAVDFSRALDTSITSAIPIRSITAGAYLNTDGVPDYITAPSVGTINVKGNFGGTVVTQSVAAIRVKGSIDGASIRASDSIGNVVAGSINASTLFAGVADSVSVLPSTASDFTNQSSRIASVKVKSGSFSDSLIAGWSVGHLKLGAVNSGSVANFGVTANHVTSVLTGGASPLKAQSLESSVDDLLSGNFSVELI